MNLDLTGDQQALRGMLRDFFEKESPPAAVRAAEPLGFDASLWRKAAELGLSSIACSGPSRRSGTTATPSTYSARKAC